MPTTSSTTDGPAHQTVTRPASSTRHASANSSLASAAAQPAIPRRPRGLLALTRGESRTGSAEGRPAGQPAGLTRQIETGNQQLKTYLRGPGRVLRSRSPDMVRQEIYGYLLTHYAISALICKAATEAGIDPDRVKFKRTVRIARRRVADPAAFPP